MNVKTQNYDMRVYFSNKIKFKHEYTRHEIKIKLTEQNNEFFHLSGHCQAFY